MILKRGHTGREKCLAGNPGPRAQSHFARGDFYLVWWALRAAITGGGGIWLGDWVNVSGSNLGSPRIEEVDREGPAEGNGQQERTRAGGGVCRAVSGPRFQGKSLSGVRAGGGSEQALKSTTCEPGHGVSPPG